MSKAGKRRNCPAVGREITSQECGENRNSKYVCTAECEFNPFARANYSQLLEAERRLDELSTKGIGTEPGHGERVQRIAQKVNFDHSHEILPFIAWETFMRKDEEGLTFMQRWERRGFPELKNDLRFLAAARMQTFGIRLLEIQRVIDGEQTECKDLFAPERPPFFLRDRSLAERACRYDTLLAYAYDLPFYSRLMGTAIMVEDLGRNDVAETVREIVRHLHGPAETPALQLWLAENLVRFTKAFTETATARRRAGFAASDLKFGKAIYRLKAPFGEARAVLDATDDVAPDELRSEERAEGFSEGRVWFGRVAGQPRSGAGEETLGRVLLGQSIWRLEAMTETRCTELQTRFEAVLGARVEFEGMRFDDLYARMHEAPASYDPALVPPSLLENPPTIALTASRFSPLARLTGAADEAALMRASDEQFLKNSIPALRGATPFEAARDPELRPLLIHLLKERIKGTDRKNLENGSSYDPAWYVRELGVTELSLEMPPKRPRLRPEKDEEDEEDEEETAETSEEDCENEDFLAEEEERPLAPALPAHLNAEEATERMSRAVQTITEPFDLEEEMERAGCEWFLDLYDYLPALSESEEALMKEVLVKVWFAMVPIGTWVELDNWVDRLPSYEKEAEDAAKSKDASATFKSRYQKDIFALAFATIVTELKDSAPDSKEKGPPLAAGAMLVFLMAAIDELHLALERQNAVDV